MVCSELQRIMDTTYHRERRDSQARLPSTMKGRAHYHSGRRRHSAARASHVSLFVCSRIHYPLPIVLLDPLMAMAGEVELPAAVDQDEQMLEDDSQTVESFPCEKRGAAERGVPLFLSMIAKKPGERGPGNLYSRLSRKGRR